MDNAKREIVAKELAEVVNRNSLENASATPDFLIADYLIDCLDVLERICKKRASWRLGELEKDDPPVVPGPTKGSVSTSVSEE